MSSSSSLSCGQKNMSYAKSRNISKWLHRVMDVGGAEVMYKQIRRELFRRENHYQWQVIASTVVRGVKQLLGQCRAKAQKATFSAVCWRHFNGERKLCNFFPGICSNFLMWVAEKDFFCRSKTHSKRW